MDKLDELISGQRAKVDSLRTSLAAITKELDREDIRLQALLEAASLREAAGYQPSKLPTSSDPEAVRLHIAARSERRGGRQPGSLDAKWRGFYSIVVEAGNKPTTLKEIVDFASRQLDLESSSARVRCRKHIDQGVLAKSGDLVFVSDSAIERFRLGNKTNSATSAEADVAVNGSAVSSSGLSAGSARSPAP